MEKDIALQEQWPVRGLKPTSVMLGDAMICLRSSGATGLTMKEKTNELGSCGAAARSSQAAMYVLV